MSMPPKSAVVAFSTSISLAEFLAYPLMHEGSDSPGERRDAK